MLQDAVCATRAARKSILRKVQLIVPNKLTADLRGNGDTTIETTLTQYP